jgi:hypothetical protein
MTTVGPVCHIPPETTVTDQPGPVGLPSIPPAGPTIASLMSTVNAIRNQIMIITGRQGSQGRQGAPGRNGSSNNAKGTWTEQARVVETVRIYQNNDPTSENWIDVERINKLAMVNKDTGQQWTWDRTRK